MRVKKNTPPGINEHLRKARLAHGLSVEQIASLVGVDERSYKRWENEHRQPGLRQQRALCEVLHATPDELDL